MLTITTSLSNDATRITNFLARNSDSFSPPLSSRVDLAEYAIKLAQKAANIFISRDNTDVGHAAIYLNNPTNAFLSSFCIDPGFQQMNLGNRLMLETISKCKAHNIQCIELEVSLQNATARTFYIRQGFLVARTNNDSVFMFKEII